MDADSVVMGRYNFDGQSFTVTAQVLDMKQLRLSSEFRETGTLPGLMDVQNALAWDMMRVIRFAETPARNTFLTAAPSVRLDALENYIRAMMDSSQQNKVRHLKEAVRINSQYDLAILELGKTYFDLRDFPNALAWLGKVPRQGSKSREAAFYAGMAAYYAGDYPR